MKRVIILPKQHFLKKNYIYNFFRSRVKLNKFFLGNNLFFLKFIKYFNYFLYINFFFKKNSIINNNTISYIPSDSIFLKNKYKNNNYMNLYGINYISIQSNIDLKNKLVVYKHAIFKKFNINFENFNYNYYFLYNYNTFINILVLYKFIK
jgi:hypothetical protein